MKQLFCVFSTIAFMLVICLSCGNKGQQTKMIETEVPERPAGQTDVLQLTAPPMETVRVGFIGLGMRGPDAVERFAQIEGTDIKGLCDVEADRVEKCQEILEKLGRPRATGYSGSTEAYKEMCERDDIDAIYSATPWQLTSSISPPTGYTMLPLLSMPWNTANM